MKTCRYCNATKNLNEFNTCKQCKDGYSHMCKSCYKEKYYVENIEYYKEKYKDNREQKLLYQKEYVVLNRHIKRAADAKRRASKLNATPKWLSKSQLLAIKEFYRLAKLLESFTTVKYHIDHIVPLQGENVCGLHVPWNLQSNKSKENLSKSYK